MLCFVSAALVAPLWADELPPSPGTVMMQTVGSLGNIAGVVLDATGAGVAEARVTLVGPDGHDLRVSAADGHGAFLLDGLEHGPFRVVVSAAGFEPYVSPQISLVLGQTYELPGIVLRVAAASTEVQVTLTMVEIATEQVHLEEKQRVLGVLPNFYTSFIFNAAPLGARQKFSLAARSVTDPTEFIAPAILAGAEQARNSFAGYGQGAAGFGKRYAAAYGDQLTHRMLASAVFPTLLHQDPRYFYLGTGTKKTRAWHAIRSAWITRTDQGGERFNYSYILGNLASGGLSNLYYPHANRGAGLVFRNAGIGFAAHAGDNLVREFILGGLTTNTPEKKGKQP